MNLAELKKYLVYTLQGSCNSLYSVVDSFSEEDEKLFYENEVEILEYIDDHIFECECCSWWYELTESTYDLICNDCAEE